MLEKSLAVYKNKPALVTEITAGKVVITLAGGESVKVREKDIEIIHPGPAGKLENIDNAPQSLKETWELLLAEGTAVPLRELAELVYGEYSPASAWAAYSLLADGLYFTGTAGAIQARQRDQVEADEKKRGEKKQAGEERELFLERLRKRRPHLTESGDSGDRRFMQDIEALALGKTAKSRTMKDIGLGETPEDAHTLLLECGFWTTMTNPHPSRFGVSLLPAKHAPQPPPAEDRRDLRHLAAFAIDSPWSHDPDDAVSIEPAAEGGHTLYVHVADPAASIGADIEQEARDRGATLYLPEGNFRMLAEAALPIFALGLSESSPALTFKMAIDAGGEIRGTEIFPSVVNVTRLTYEAADKLIAEGAQALRALYAIAERNLLRRNASGAIIIDMPECHINVHEGQVSIEPVLRCRSADLVRECMLLAGEGAGMWAIQRNLPFPFIGQEMGELPDDPGDGLAGAYQLRRCMRPRALSVRPARHWGLGLEVYTQVTSPLRRYTDLLAHSQIRAVLDGGEPLSAEEVSARMIAGEAAMAAVNQAERASRSHWTMVYLSDKKDTVWDAVALEQKGSRWVVSIPALALETQVPLRAELRPNDPLRLVLKSVNIPRLEAIFAAE